MHEACAGALRACGHLDVSEAGHALLRDLNDEERWTVAYVPAQMVRSLGLRQGDLVEGEARDSERGRWPALARVASVNGRPPAEVRDRPRFSELVPVYPSERLRLERAAAFSTERAIDLVAPIGKGQRGLIVSPPKAGKTTVLKRVCQALEASAPDVRVMCLLVDERPEEVADFRRSVAATVYASTFDCAPAHHVRVAELACEHAKRLVESGEDVVVLLDSITRLARACNLASRSSGRVLTGGVEASSLYRPKRFLGAARNVEGPGSLTMLATALVETGSKMDEVIFEELKGTGNMELRLDRGLAERRVFPAIDPISSGTRNEELLMGRDELACARLLRRRLARARDAQAAAKMLLDAIAASKSNRELLSRVALTHAR